MAKRSKIVANERRKATVARYAERRAALRKAIRTAATAEERDEAQRRLRKLPRDASPVRVRNRDAVDGRPRGFLRVAGVSRGGGVNRGGTSGPHSMLGLGRDYCYRHGRKSSFRDLMTAGLGKWGAAAGSGGHTGRGGPCATR